MFNFLCPHIVLVASSPHDVVAVQPPWLLTGPDSEVSLVCSAIDGDNRFIWLHNASNVVCGSNCPISSSFIQGKFYLKDRCITLFLQMLIVLPI